MSYSVKTTIDFDGEAKRIAKKHKGIKSDIAKLITELSISPTMGTRIGKIYIRSGWPFQGPIKENPAERE